MPVIRVARRGSYNIAAGTNKCFYLSERDSIKAELDSLHEDYSKLYDSFKRLRGVAEEQKQVIL